MENIIPLISTVLFLAILKTYYFYIKKAIILRGLLIEIFFDSLGICMFYTYPFIITLLDSEGTSGLPDFISQGPLIFRAILAVILLLGLPAFLSYAKCFMLNRFSISTGPYFWIGNTTYFIFVIPIILVILTGIIDKLAIK